MNMRKDTAIDISVVTEKNEIIIFKSDIVQHIPIFKNMIKSSSESKPITVPFDSRIIRNLITLLNLYNDGTITPELVHKYVDKYDTKQLLNISEFLEIQFLEDILCQVIIEIIERFDTQDEVTKFITSN